MNIPEGAVSAFRWGRRRDEAAELGREREKVRSRFMGQSSVVLRRI